MGRRRTKSDWAGVCLGDAFKRNLDYYERRPAARLFYAAARRVQLAALHLANVVGSPTCPTATPPLKSKPQLLPFFTGYPSAIAAHAALGLTGFVEFQAQVKESALLVHLADYLKGPAVF